MDFDFDDVGFRHSRKAVIGALISGWSIVILVQSNEPRPFAIVNHWVALCFLAYGLVVVNWNLRTICRRGVGIIWSGVAAMTLGTIIVTAFLSGHLDKFPKVERLPLWYGMFVLTIGVLLSFWGQHIRKKYAPRNSVRIMLTDPLPKVCFECGQPADSDMPLLFQYRDRKHTLRVPMCPLHCSHPPSLSTLVCLKLDSNAITLGNVSEVFLEAFNDAESDRATALLRSIFPESELAA